LRLLWIFFFFVLTEQVKTQHNTEKLLVFQRVFISAGGSAACSNSI